MSVVDLLNANGICRVPSPYSSSDLARLNGAVDSILRGRSSEKRSYVHVDEILDLGMLDVVLGSGMRDILFSIMPDPVLYHCFVIETAGNDPEPNLLADQIAGWHRDIDCSFSLLEPTHVSVFVYLSDVGDDDGAFEFVPQNPRIWLRSSAPSVLVKGEAGYAFAWQRSYFHRASPNRGPRRRRLIKLSIQRNAFQSAHLTNAHFRRTIEALPAGDVPLDILFGRYQGSLAPAIPPCVAVSGVPIQATGVIAIDDPQLLKAQLRGMAGAAKRRVRELLGGPAKRVAYD